MAQVTTLAALFAWPLVAAVLFARFDRETALAWTIVGGLMVLPETGGLNLPILPSYDKQFAPALAALLMAVATERGRDATPALRGWLPSNWIALSLLALLVLVSPVMTTLANRAPLVFGPRVLPGMGLYDIGSIVLQTLVMVLPMVLGRRYLSTDAAHAALLRCLVLGALAYTVLIVIELRLSPQFHFWFYGTYPREFVHNLRGGGFRPVGFFAHGLNLAMFVAAALLGAIALWRATSGARRPFYAAASGWLAILLFLCKSIGPLALGLGAATALRLVGARMVLIGSAAIVAIALTIPVLRTQGAAPVDQIAAVAGAIDPGRAASFLARVENEDRMLERVRSRQAFGYGIWGRWRVYNPETGADITASDSYWMITLGQFGWLGYACVFGLLALPVFLAALRRRRLGLTMHTVGLCVILAIFFVDLMVNVGLPLLHWLIAGAVLGRLERAPAEAGTALERAGGATVGRRARLEPAIGALPAARLRS